MTLTENSEKANRRKKVIEYANQLNSVFSAKRKLSILETDIWTNFKEQEYLKHTIHQKSKLIEKILAAIEKIEPQVLKMRTRYVQIENKKDALEKKYKNLLDIQKKIADKKLELSNNNSAIAKFNLELGQIDSSLRVLEKQHNEIIARKDKMEESFYANSEKLKGLTTELEVHKNTCALINGFLPESSVNEDPGDPILKNSNGEEYKTEAIDPIEQIQNEIAAMTSEMPVLTIRKSELNETIKSFDNKIAELNVVRKSDRDHNSLKSEITKLNNKKDGLRKTIEENKNKITNLVYL